MKTIKEFLLSFPGHWDIYIFGNIVGAIAAIIALIISGVKII